MANLTVPFEGITDQALKDLLAECPTRWQGDIGFQNWCKEVYDRGAASAVPAPAPTITALSPNTAPANADVTVAITGTGFDSGATVTIGTAYGLTPIGTPTPTGFSVLVKAVNIAQAGTLPMSVKNGDGQISNTLDFTVT